MYQRRELQGRSVGEFLPDQLSSEKQQKIQTELQAAREDKVPVCPKCDTQQKNVSVRFCMKCGFGPLAKVEEKAAPAPAAARKFCRNCGSVSGPNATVCVKV